MLTVRVVRPRSVDGFLELCVIVLIDQENVVHGCVRKIKSKQQVGGQPVVVTAEKIVARNEQLQSEQRIGQKL